MKKHFICSFIFCQALLSARRRVPRRFIGTARYLPLRGTRAMPPVVDMLIALKKDGLRTIELKTHVL